MADRRDITGTITTQQDSRARVALDLMDFIQKRVDVHAGDVDAWFVLYAKCYRAAEGQRVEDILAVTKPSR